MIRDYLTRTRDFLRGIYNSLIEPDEIISSSIEHYVHYFPKKEEEKILNLEDCTLMEI